MFVTDRFVPESYDGFVVGSGPAGVSLSLALAAAGRRVLIFESGDADSTRSELSNSVGYGHYSGEYWNQHWFRALGGTSNVWSGWCATLRELDLDNPVVGARWPIPRSELLPYWRKAAPILDHDPAFVDVETPLIPGFNYRPVPTENPTRIGRKYLATLQTSPRVDVALGRTLVGIDANASRTAVIALDYVDHLLEFKRRMTVAPAQFVVVAAGAMGNAQLLLQPRGDGAVSVGNESGQVGKFLMEHPQFTDAGRVRARRGTGPLLAEGEQRRRHARGRARQGVLCGARTVRMRSAMLPEDRGPPDGPVSLVGAGQADVPLRHDRPIGDAARRAQPRRPDRRARSLGTVQAGGRGACSTPGISTTSNIRCGCSARR